MLALRPFQSEAIERARAAIRAGSRRVLIQSPTGSGKTVLSAFMLRTVCDRGKRSWFVVHRRELLEQSVATLQSVGLDVATIEAGRDFRSGAPVTVAMVQTLARRMDRVEPPDVVVWDECQHVVSNTYASIQAYLPSETVQIGLSATPERLDGRGLAKHFDVLIPGQSVKWLIGWGFLSPYKYFAPPTVSADDMGTSMGDYKKSDVVEAVDRPTITGCAIEHYKKLCPGKRALVFCASIEHSEHVAESFRAAGVDAVHLDGETAADVRRDRMADFRAGSLDVISSVDLFGEGLDVPGIEAVILLRPTQSLALHLQQVGRALRPQPGKTAIICDHVGNVTRHGFPCEDRIWTLEQDRRKRRGTTPVRTCPSCYAALPIAVSKCPECGHEFDTEKSREPEQVAGKLVELTPQQRARQESACETYEELAALGRARGYRPGWAFHRWNARKLYQATRAAIHAPAPEPVTVAAAGSYSRDEIYRLLTP